MHDRHTQCRVTPRGELVQFSTGTNVTQCDFVFALAPEYNILRAMVNWKLFGQLPKRVIN